MKIVMREACETKDKGSIGCRFVGWSAESAGFEVDYEGDSPCDIELVSVHHVSDYPRLARLPRIGKVRIVGGNPCAINYKPILPFADVICVGEGEAWIKDALNILSVKLDVSALSVLPGTVICSAVGAEPSPNMEKEVPDHPAYLNKESEGHVRTWYIEMARGCPHRCHYCSLGNIVRYRIKPTAQIISRLEEIDQSKSKRVSLFAPDEASHPGYADILRKIKELGLVTRFGSMRIEPVMRHNLPIDSTMLIRVGMDGLTEETRFRVGRKQTDRDFIDYFRWMSERGHSNFKIFMIVGFPWEQASDLDEWIKLMSAIGRIERKTNAHVRIKITPLIPQPHTPLAAALPVYDFDLISRLEKWISTWRPKRTPGWFFEQDGTVMSRKNWIRDCELARGNEQTLSK